MKRIKLYRPIENFNKNCSYEILVNGGKIAELKNGEEKIIEIPNETEPADLAAKIQWCGSEKLQIAELNDLETVKVSGNKFLNKRMPFIGAIFPLTGLMIFDGGNELLRNMGIGFLILLLLGVIGTLTIWKNKWLNVSQE